MQKNLSLGRLSRRAFVTGTAAATMMPRPLSAGSRAADYKICGFAKYIQPLSFAELAEQVAAMGYDGIEATVRDGGQIEPPQASEELPGLVEALRKHNLEITIMASSINRADGLSEKVLRTAAKLGVRRYRMAYYRYDLSRSVARQVAELRPVVKDLAALNRELGITGVYQNHAGPTHVGSTIWDLVDLFEDIPPQEMSIGFDIRHATAEAGLAWPQLFNVASPHLGAVYVKDFVWKGRRVENVALGRGRVDKNFLGLVRDSGFTGPISLHVEYLGKAGVAANLAAMKDDLITLRRWLTQAG